MAAYKSVLAFIFGIGLILGSSAGAALDTSPLLVFAEQPVQGVGGLADLPASIRSLLEARLPHGIAAVGARYNATDYITDESLPSRRLLGAGRTGALWFVWYEHGGRGYHQHLVLLRPGGTSSAEVVASAIFLQEPRNLEALQQLAKAGALAPGPLPEPEHW
jgi:hypothetical protein